MSPDYLHLITVKSDPNCAETERCCDVN